MKYKGLISRSAIAVYLCYSIPVLAQDAPPQAAAAEPGQTIIVTGTRRTDRTVAESPTPIDVYSGVELQKQGTADMNQVIQNLVPSFSVARYAIGDGSSFVRPPNLRGLAPDQTLVLINGKRMHRSALVQIGANAQSAGAHSADLAQVPAIAVRAVEVLRDGASAQYGSDAIAGVINMTLRDDTDGISGYARYGQYYRGDGEDYQLALNGGFKLGDSGFINISGEYVNAGKTSRGVTRAGADLLAQEQPTIGVPKLAQRYGNPKMESYRFFVNGGFDLGDDASVYFFGNYGHSFQEESFNYRQSLDTAGVDIEGNSFGRNGIFNDYFTDFDNTRPGIQTGAAGGNVYAPNSFEVNGAFAREGSVVRDYTKVSNCSDPLVQNWSCVYPGGFTPIFFGKIDDVSGTVGYKGKLGFGLNYDISGSYGQSTLRYTMNGTMNPSLGITSPNEFYLGKLEQRETLVNADFSYPWEVGFASPVTIAFGGQYFRESYELGLGDQASYAIGSYTGNLVFHQDGTPVYSGFDENGDPVQLSVNLPVGANGFPGYSPAIAGESARNSKGLYIDIEGDVTEQLSFGIAGRYEHLSDFGNSTTGKFSARYAVVPDIVALRGTVATGFRAPTPGQVNSSSIATGFNPGNPNAIESMTLPVTSPVAAFLGATPLKPEESVSFSLGTVFTPAPGFTLSVDYYNIKVKDRIGTSGTFEIKDSDRPTLQSLGLANYATVNEVQFLTNAFDTRTQGVDVVGSYRFATDNMGSFNTTLAFNYNKTKVTKWDPDIVSATRIQQLEKTLPKTRVILTENWNNGPFSVLARMNWYGKYTQSDDGTGLNNATYVQQTFGSEFVFDFETSYEVNDNFTLSVGVQNLFSNYPDKYDNRAGGLGPVYGSTGGRFTGDIYPDVSPFGFNGGFWYGKVGFKF
ncbi:TonB-dependent receptor [Sphingobium sp. Leaf26]|uniref:TonB-dependent receptor plug domain-containing protein n=1 Tax=Sphingobium sp. Leaf26 TaxID=1735693 RepID=UPI000700E1CA|nr:TonB-dependent receptor [Sphingobium sp. Leaf26]KQN06595.1 TonB-dependent receptor [Sphingobium sp. Leaf26]